MDESRANGLTSIKIGLILSEKVVLRIIWLKDPILFSPKCGRQRVTLEELEELKGEIVLLFLGLILIIARF